MGGAATHSRERHVMSRLAQAHHLTATLRTNKCNLKSERSAESSALGAHHGQSRQGVDAEHAHGFRLHGRSGAAEQRDEPGQGHRGDRPNVLHLVGLRCSITASVKESTPNLRRSPTAGDHARWQCIQPAAATRH